MLREAYLIKIIKLFIFYGAYKTNKSLHISRKYVKIKSEKFRWYHVNSPLTIELVRELF